MKRLSRYIPALRYGAVIDSKAPAGGTAAGQTVVLPVYEFVNVALTASSATSTVYVADTLTGNFVIAGVSEVHGTASSSGTLQVEAASGTTAAGSGTVQLTGTMSLAGTANTPVNGTVIASPTTIAAGSRINIVIAGTMTNLANSIVTIVLQRIA